SARCWVADGEVRRVSVRVVAVRVARVALAGSGRDRRGRRGGSLHERVRRISPADRVDDVPVRVLDRDASGRRGEADRKRLVRRMRTRIAGASEEEEPAGCERRSVGERAERDVARAGSGPVDELPAGEVGRRGPDVDDLDELVAERALDADRELVDADPGRSARARNTPDLREPGPVVGDRDCPGLTGIRARKAGQSVERGERRSGGPLGALSPGRTLGAGGPLRACGAGRPCRPLGAPLIPGERPLAGPAGRGPRDDAKRAAVHLPAGMNDAVSARDGGDGRAREHHGGDRERDENLRAHASPSIEWHAPLIALRFARECRRAGTGTDPRKRGFKSPPRMPIEPRWLPSAWQTTPSPWTTARTRSRKPSRPPTCSVGSRARSPSTSTNPSTWRTGPTSATPSSARDSRASSARSRRIARPRRRGKRPSTRTTRRRMTCSRGSRPASPSRSSTAWSATTGKRAGSGTACVRGAGPAVNCSSTESSP